MKASQTLLLVVGFLALTLYNLSPSANVEEGKDFEVWVQTTNKNYADDAERAYRLMVWKSNRMVVQEHNAKFEAGLESFELEMNEFADLTEEEFASRYLMQKTSGASVEATSECTGKEPSAQNVPEEFDWTEKGAVTYVKNQGQCGSCWAFSATGSLEGAHYISKNSLEAFSEQQLVDCSRPYGNQGCLGGLMNYSFFYVKDHGITTEKKYPYQGIGIVCIYEEETDKVWGISDCTEVTTDNEEKLLAAVAQQPVSVAIQANGIFFQLYRRGVFTAKCGTNLDHGVLVVGYGEQNEKKYWKVKNSWGGGWGMEGYILMERTGDGPGKCGIQMAASFAVA